MYFDQPKSIIIFFNESCHRKKKSWVNRICKNARGRKKLSGRDLFRKEEQLWGNPNRSRTTMGTKRRKQGRRYIYIERVHTFWHSSI